MPYPQKEKIRVVVYTLSYRIEGDMHIIPGSRLTDILNVKAKDFIPFTDVKILAPQEDVVIHESSYAAVLRDSIIMIAPLEKVIPSLTSLEE